MVASEERMITPKGDAKCLECRYMEDILGDGQQFWACQRLANEGLSPRGALTCGFVRSYRGLCGKQARWFKKNEWMTK